MPKFDVSAESLGRQLRKNEKQVAMRLENYLIKPGVDEVHDLRTSIRRLRVYSGFLPKSLRKKSSVREYLSTHRKLFKLNTQIRDLDIAESKLRKECNTHPAYEELLALIQRQRAQKVLAAKKFADAHKGFEAPKIPVRSIDEKKLDKRLNKILRKLASTSNNEFQVVVNDPSKILTLHSLRKHVKRLRYSLELFSDGTTKMTTTKKKKWLLASTIKLLTDWQDLLGSIRDFDMMVDYLRKAKVAHPTDDIQRQILEQRSKEYEKFVRLTKETDIFGRVNSILSG